MIVSRSQRVLFVHVQKTGGQTVEAVMLEQLEGAETLRDLPGAKHARLGAALRAHPDWADYWTFGFVRNPWARLWSWYSMIDRRGTTAHAGNEWVEGRIQRNSFWSGVLLELPDFDAFVMRGPDIFPRIGLPQVAYLRTKRQRADFIGRTENFDADFATVCERVGIEPPAIAPRRNAGPGGDYREQYSAAMRDRVAELFARDLRAFGYEFD